MYKKLDNESCKECINEYMNNQDKLSVSEYCKIHNLRKEQFYYHRLENNNFKWPVTDEEALKVNIDELNWILKGYEVRIALKFKTVKASNGRRK